MYHLVNEQNIMIMIMLLLSLLLYISEGSLEICQGITTTINTNHTIIIITTNTATNTIITVTNTITTTIIITIIIIISKLCIIRSYHRPNKDDRHKASSLEAC